MKKKPEESFPTLAEVEAEVMAEGREWTRQRMAKKLQELADRQSEVFPPKPTATGASAPVSVRVKHRSGRR
jgi:hypothetical protein